MARLRNVGGAPGLPKGVWGGPRGRVPHAVLMLIHGGSWTGISPASFNATLGTAAVLQTLGYETFTVDYRRGAQGVTDLDNLYVAARQQVGPSVPICAIGVSAGGHLALVLAEHHPDLACVIDFAGPTDLPALRTEPHGQLSAYTIALTAFGAAPLAELSPALHPGTIKAKLMLLYAQTDPLVPVEQGRIMARAYPSAQLIVLPPGSAPFVHTGVGAPAQTTGVDPTARLRADQQEQAFLRAATGS